MRYVFRKFLGIISIFLLFGCQPPSNKYDQMTLKEACLSFEGTWLAETNECEWISEEACQKLNGTFNQCASDCRNEMNDSANCSLSCIQVCQL